MTNGQISRRVDEFLVSRGALVRVNDAGRELGQIIAFNNPTFDVTRSVPTVVMRNEDYGRLSRLLAGGTSVTLEFNIVNTTNWTIGNHAVKFGFDYRRLFPASYSGLYKRQFLPGSIANLVNNTPSAAAIIAPQIFNAILEFPLLLVAGLACRPGVRTTVSAADQQLIEQLHFLRRTHLRHHDRGGRRITIDDRRQVLQAIRRRKAVNARHPFHVWMGDFFEQR